MPKETTEQYAIAGLRRKRDAIVTEIGDPEVKLQLLTMNLGHVEATLRMLQPDILLEALPTTPILKRAKRGENSRPVLAALHAANGRPVSTKECARAILHAHGKPALRVHKEAYEAARASLRDLRRRRQERALGPGDGSGQTWKLVRD